MIPAKSELPETMQALMCYGPEDYRLEAVPVPEPGPGEVIVRVLGAGICAVILTVTATPVAAQCVGDCNGDEEVTINELLTGVNIALGNAPVESCPVFDANDDGEVTIAGHGR